MGGVVLYIFRRQTLPGWPGPLALRAVVERIACMVCETPDFGVAMRPTRLWGCHEAPPHY